MYNAILIDDEPVVLDGLRTHVNWARHDVSVVGTFPDGQEAYRFITEHPVDLIVTDVCTPHMDGIELARRARALYPAVKILFVSGFADVNYLKDAMKLEAVDYILKSIDLDEMDAALTRVVGKIDEERERTRKLNEMEKLLDLSLPTLRALRLSSLLHSADEDTPDVVEELRFLGVPMDDVTHYVILVVWLRDKWKVMGGMNERERLLFSLKIQTVCEEILRDHDGVVCFKDRVGEYILIVRGEGEECETVFLDAARQVRERLLNELGLNEAIGISKRFKGIVNVREAYRSACESIERRYLLEPGQPISVTKYEEVDDLRAARDKARKDILGAIMDGDADAVRAAAKAALSTVRSNPSADEQQNFLIYLLLLPARLLTGIRTEDKGLYASQRHLLERFLLCRTGDEQEALLLQAYDGVTALLADRSQPQPNAIIRHVRELIEKRYAERLSVADLAGEVFLTPTYLCVLFKQQTGMTINDCITRTRMDRARELLTDPAIMLYDVCYKVGYLSPSYFSRLFKKYTGQTPSEYRDSAVSGL